MHRKKILFVVAHRPGRSPGQLFRFEQYLQYLSEHGCVCEISNYLDEQDDKIFYSKGNYFRKLLILMKAVRQRFHDVRRADAFDVIFIYRDAIMIGVTWFERQLSRSKARVILDFDDAIWLPDVSNGNAGLGWMKRPSKTKTTIRRAQLVLAGNQYLADYARQYNSRVAIMPTTLDIEVYRKVDVLKPDGAVCIGWTGSSTTLKHLERAVPILKRVKEKYGHRVYFRVIADQPLFQKGIEFDWRPWHERTAVLDLNSFDIGIMPLPDDSWSKGKCAFKALQYMSVEVPAVVSPVGVNSEIIRHGENGFLADTDDEWFEVLSCLIDSPALRSEIGKNGRSTVKNKYSFQSQKERYLGFFTDGSTC